MRGGLNYRRRDRLVSSLQLSPRLKLLRLPTPECLAGRLLHEHERVQLEWYCVPRPATFRIRSDHDALGFAGNIHYSRHHRWIIRTDLPAGRSRWLNSATRRCTCEFCAVARLG